jgi:integrase
LETKRSQLILDQQAIGSGFIPAHKYKSNFLDYYAEFVKTNQRERNVHLQCSLNHFKIFLTKPYISPIEITENLCIRFRQYLLDHLNGECPANYFVAFKRVLRTAAKEGYFRLSPAQDVKSKENKNKRRKENLEAEEYIQLLNTPLFNEEIREAFIFCCYTGLRFCDVQALAWKDIHKKTLTTKIIQEKTGEPMKLTLHDTASRILERRREGLKPDSDARLVFALPSANGCNKALGIWCDAAGIDKHITWHCARLSFSILLQDKNVDAATVALLLGHTTTKYVLQTYKRHRPKDQSEAIAQLPALGADY